MKWVSWILTRLNVLTGSQQTTPLIVGSHVTNCNREYQNTCKLETDVNYCCSCCACCCVEVAHFICSAIITSCWHQDCWHQLTTPVRPKGGGWRGGGASSQQQTRFDLARDLNTQLWIRKKPYINGFERRPAASLNSLVPVSMNLSLLLIKAHQERCETGSTSTWWHQREKFFQHSWKRFHCGLFIFVDLSAKQWDFGSPKLQKHTTWLCEFQPLKRG